MHEADFLRALALVMCVAAVTTVLFQYLRQPVVLGYVLAGLIVGPYVPIPLLADHHIVEELAELGVILLMFSLGLEFSVRKLIRVGPTAGLTALIECSLMVWLGTAAGRAFGWTGMEALFTGAFIAISSTTIVAKAFDEQGVSGRRRELVVAILIVEDLIAILLLTALTAISEGEKLSTTAFLATIGRIALFLLTVVAAGMLFVPRFIRLTLRLNRPETTLVAAVGICFGLALLARSAGYSVALGAFLAGSLVAEAGDIKPVEHLVQPVRDMFAAVFFVSVGMMIDPKMMAANWGAILVLTALVVGGKIAAVTVGAFLTGNGTRRSVQAAMSLAQIGEFSFIIAGLGVTSGATRPFLYPIPIAVSLLTTLLTPALIRLADPAARLVDRKLPRSLQTFSALYASWLEQIRHSRAHGPRQQAWRLVRLLLLDAAALGGLIVGASIGSRKLAGLVQSHTQLAPQTATLVVVATATVAALPFLLGIFRLAAKLGLVLAEMAMPQAARLDLAAAPRSALVLTLQLTVFLATGIPLLALVQPFVRGGALPAVVICLLAVLAFTFWRSATNLHGHVTAGTEAILEVLAAQSRETPPDHALAEVSTVLPGLGAPKSIHLTAASFATGRTLGELNLRGMTGATVLAISRHGDTSGPPNAHQRLEAEDLLVLAGSSEAVAAGESLLLSGQAQEASRV